MNERRQDFEQLQRFTRAGEQSAFADVVRRHLDLVFATALRKLEDPGAAQEVAQNVFAALGRKAWQFAPDDSLPAWLHKTALFEANTWLRGEIRRRRREEIAAELGTTMNTLEEQPAFADLMPLLDEALLSLRERDRTALLLRFHESRSLRDVGAAVGVSEDAARMRVQAALEKLTKFFQRRGFKTASVAVVAAALTHAATTASAAVATSLMGAAREITPPTLTGFKSLLARLAILTKPQRAALGGALAMALLLLCLFLTRSLEAGTRPTISLERTDTNMTIRFTGALQSAEQPQGPFRPVPGARSPLVVPAGAGQEFWRAWLPGVHSIAAGNGHTLALRTDGTLWAWGWNRYGQLGIGTFDTNAPYGTNTPQRVGSETNWQAVAAGWHTVALRTDGTLWAWGANGSGQLGIGTFTTYAPYGTNTPQQVGTNANWQAVAAGTHHTVALRTDGTIWAWGANHNGHLGNGTYTDTNTPQMITTVSNWLAVAAGLAHTVALHADGTLWAWGNNGRGELGIGSFATNAPWGVNTPQQVGTNADWQAVAAGYGHTLALRTDGTLWAWGFNDRGQLGIGTFSTNDPYAINTPQQVGSDTNWLAISASDHTVALRADGTLWAWGYNDEGELGNGTYTSTITPQQVGNDTNWQTVATRGNHTVALRVDGTLWAWGWNGSGQLGNGTYTSTNTPQQVGYDTNWQAIAAGGPHTVAVRTDGTLWAWGGNDLGQLGNGTYTSTNTPQRIGTATNWQAIAAGNAYTVALCVDGTLWAWGDNDYGQLGIGLGTPSTNYPYFNPDRTNTPQQVGTNTNWGPPP
jgi:RNA polymerase sigma factor (sigma-70 family)